MGLSLKAGYSFLAFRQESDVQFRNDGITSVPVDDTYQGFDAAGFVDVVSDFLVLAEVERTVRYAVPFFQNPHLFGWQIVGGNRPASLVTFLREIGYKTFGIDRYLQQVFGIFRRRSQYNVQVSVLQFLNQSLVGPFVNEETDARISFPE